MKIDRFSTDEFTTLRVRSSLIVDMSTMLVESRNTVSSDEGAVRGQDRIAVFGTTPYKRLCRIASCLLMQGERGWPENTSEI